MVEADAIKNKDVVYQQLNKRLSRMGRSTSDLSKYVHEYSTKAAESMFVAAINQQRVRGALIFFRVLCSVAAAPFLCVARGSGRVHSQGLATAASRMRTVTGEGSGIPTCYVARELTTHNVILAILAGRHRIPTPRQS